eukprot:gene58273-77753_t
MPKASELTNPELKALLPELKKKYEADEAYALERMRRPNPLLNEDWGKSKMELIQEANDYARQEERKEKLKGLLSKYQEEEE